MPDCKVFIIFEFQAIAFGMKAQDSLNKMQKESEDELKVLYADYQEKMNKMVDMMEMKFKQDHRK